MVRTVLILLISFLFFFSVTPAGLDIPQAYAAASENSQGAIHVTVETANVRKGPGPDFPVIMRLGEGVRVVEKERRDKWILISVLNSEASGWVSSNLLKSSSMPGQSSSVDVKPVNEKKAVVADVKAPAAETKAPAAEMKAPAVEEKTPVAEKKTAPAAAEVAPVPAVAAPAPVAEKMAAPGLMSLLSGLLNEHERIKAAEEQRDVAMHQLRVAKGGWYPKLNLSADAGQEKVVPPVGENTDEFRNYSILRGTQLLTDFGRQNSIVDRADRTLAYARLNLEATRQQVLLEGITAYLNVLRAREKLKFALESEENIRKQTGMEEALVERGAGLSSDVLQTKSQLAGARALRVSVEGELARAKNRFLTVFKRYPTDEELVQFQLPKNASDKLVAILEEAIANAEKNNPRFLMAKANVEIVKQDLKFKKAQYFPTLNLFAEGERREDDAGLIGIREEGIVGVEFNYNLFNGGSDQAGIRAAAAQVRQAENQQTETGFIVGEQVRNAWQNLITSRENHKFLQNQANIMGEFLQLARKERKLGNRTLLEVLTGEVNYINSVSLAVSAQVDTIIAAYTLQHATGNLTLDVF